MLEESKVRSTMTTMWGFRGGARWAMVLAAFSVLLVASPPTYAQCVSGSDGSDGAITFSVPSGLSSVVLDFNPRTICSQVGVSCTKTAGPGSSVELDTDGDNVYHFTTVTVGQSVSLRLLAKNMRNPGPVVWLALGDVTFNRYSTLDLYAQNGHVGGQNYSVRTPSEPGPGGYPGGVGAKPGDLPGAGGGPGAGAVPSSEMGCSAGHVIALSTVRCSGGGAKYGTDSIQPLVGGSGGSGGHAYGTFMGAGGGAGGGAIRITSGGTLTLPREGFVNVRGGYTRDRQNGGYGGGAGSGGAAHFQAPVITCQSTTIAAEGGQGNGENGANGRIRFDSNAVPQGCINYPTALTGPLLNVPLPAAFASVRVVSFGGQAVPEVPDAAYTAPDVNVDSTAPLAVAIEAKNIPRGTVVKLIVSSEGSGAGTADQTVDTTPLVGDSDALTTATAQVTLPRGVSRVFVRAVW